MDPKRRDVLAGLFTVGSVVGAFGMLDTPPAEAQHLVGEGDKPGLGPFTKAELNRIVSQAVASANQTPSPLRSIEGTERFTKMHIAIVTRNGTLLRLHSMADAWEGSIDIAVAKARTAAFFSSNENALTSRIIGVLSQPSNSETGEGPAGPLWGIWASNQGPGIPGLIPAHRRNGIITFPGGVPLYKNGKLVGGIGVSGDGVDQDETVAFGGAAGFEPPPGVAALGFELPTLG